MIDQLVGSSLIPDFLLRIGVRHVINQRRHEIKNDYSGDPEAKLLEYANNLRKMPIAIETDKANEQHYEVPSEFYEYVLGKNLKYSCCSYDKAKTLNEAEEEMLELYLQRAEIKDGMTILDLGCGWGSFSVYAAKKFPKCTFHALSNSHGQREHIERRRDIAGIKNLTIHTGNVVDFEFEQKFDRVVSIEMFEHMKNYEQLLKKVSRWLLDDGKLFVHIFTHTKAAYPYEVKDDTDWMTKYFFSGGQMPAEGLLFHFQEDLKMEKNWTLPGVHYQKTSRHWLENMDKNKQLIIPLFQKTYGSHQAEKWFNYWRMFFIACEELWATSNGNEWTVSHYLMRKK